MILRPGSVRFELINDLLVAAYRYRNWPLRDRFLPILRRGLGLLIKQDLLMKEGQRYIVLDSLLREWIARQTF